MERRIFTGRQNRYVAVYRPEHPRAWSTGYVYEHVLVMEKKLGRFLERGEVVHHKDDDGHNNRPKNLELKTRSRHTAEHNIERGSMVLVACGWCGGLFELQGWVYRQRKAKAHGDLFCSRSCGAKKQHSS